MNNSYDVRNAGSFEVQRAYPSSKAPTMTETARTLAAAIEKADWSNVSIGNKVLLKGAVAHLRSPLPGTREEVARDAIAIERLIFKHVKVRELFDGAMEFVGTSAAADAILAALPPASMPEREGMREALEQIIAINQATVSVDGKVLSTQDGYCAKIARAALASHDDKSQISD